MGQTRTARRRSTASAREKAAAARANARRREQRRRLLTVVGSSVGVLAIVVALVVVGLVSGTHQSKDTGRQAASAAVLSAVTGMPSTTLSSIGKGTVTQLPKSINDAALTADGRPEVLFLGAEYCPYCAAERWPLVQALSRFGTFSGLNTVRSSGSDVYPNTATFSFYGSSYSSSTVSFVGRELQTTSGAHLESPTSAESKLWKKYTGQGSYPFLDIGGRYVVTTPSYNPGVLKGLTAAQIAAQLADPSSTVARAVGGAANVLTAAICTTTNNQPAAVCSAPGVTAAAKSLSG